MDQAAIGKRLKQLRRDKDVSMERMARDLDISTSAVNAYEMGVRMPRDEIKIKIADYFGATVQEIFFD